MRQLKTQLFLVVTLLTLSFSAFCADKALLIGVGNYQNPQANLPGIALDVALFKRVLKRMDLQEQNIRVLMDGDATESNIKRVMGEFFADVAKQDRVFVYFSGHGSQTEDNNGDESDGLDEFLLTYDFDDQHPQKGMLTDDELNVLLKAIPSDNVYAFIDSCHSGSVSKGLNLLTVSQPPSGEGRGTGTFGPIAYMPMAKAISTRVPRSSNSADNFVAITATQDDEIALVSSQGSLFTLGISHTIDQALTSNRSITAAQLVAGTTAYISANTANGNRFTPSISGNSSLYNKAIPLIMPTEQGQYWQALLAYAQTGTDLTVATDKQNYQLNETMRFSIDSPIDGYLNIVSVDENDNAMVIYPNKFHRNNRVNNGELFVTEPARLGFRLFGTQPLGKSLTIAIITRHSLSLYEKALAGRDITGEILANLAPVSTGTMRAIGLEAAGSDMYSGSIIINVVN